MLNDHGASTSNAINIHGEEQEEQFRDIHALTPPPPPHNPSRPRSWRPIDGWETSGRRSSNLSMASDATNASENFTTMSHEFNSLVLAGSAIATHNHGENDVVDDNNNNNNNLGMIGEEEEEEETNPLAIVPDNHPLDPPPVERSSGGGGRGGDRVEAMSVQRVKKEEVEAKISAWQNAKVAKINNRFKREDAVINGWENEKVQKATSWMKKVERKLEEKRVKAMEKMQNDIAKSRRKAEERKASAEAKRGTKVARILEVANLMRAVGKPPSKRSFF